jgi:hypothetical protein
MKRRTFLTSLFGVGALAVAAPIAYVSTHKKEVAVETTKYLAKKKARALFKRFFTTANGFEPNMYQMHWFHRYQEGSKSFVGARQTGMTTFMLTLALYENKCNGTNISWFPSNSHMHRHCNNLMSVMQERLGKSINDGHLYSSYGDFENLLGSNRPLKVFVMNDAGRLPNSFEGSPYLLKQSHFFGTDESYVGHRGSEYAKDKYYAPYFPIHYT